MVQENGLKQLLQMADRNKAVINAKFFKTDKGEYSEGEKFIGLTNPQIRKWIKQYYRYYNLDSIKVFIYDTFHEIRLTGWLLLVNMFQKEYNIENQKRLINFYIEHIHQVNNWDLVDLTAYHLLGEYLVNNSRDILYQLVKSSYLWERRIAIVSTYAFIKREQYKETFNLSLELMNDKEELIHKACGWMLREIGKRDKQLLITFLCKNKKNMPRIMLRYAIERLNPEERKELLQRK